MVGKYLYGNGPLHGHGHADAELCIFKTKHMGRLLLHSQNEQIVGSQSDHTMYVNVTLRAIQIHHPFKRYITFHPN